MNRNCYFGLGFLWFFLLIGCDADKNHPGYTYFPDMAYSRAFETYAENPNFTDSKTMREPVEGTIPRGYEPFPYEKTDEDMIRAGQELKNPLLFTEENIARGQEVFSNFCAQCHGEDRDGTGFLYTSGRYIYPPASLITDKMKAKPEGEIYHSITVGFGVMGAHGLLLKPEDRWKVTMYIKKELQ